MKTTKYKFNIIKKYILNIFVSKAEIKHTNSKVIITIYIYNRQKKYLMNKLDNIKILKELKERVKLIEKQKYLISYDMMYNNIYSYEDKRYKDFIKKSLEKEILTIYIRQLLHFNKSKFEDTYLCKLSNIIKKCYKIIKIKKLYKINLIIFLKK